VSQRQRAKARSAELAGDLDSIVMKALQRPLALRYATAQALADDLERYLDGRAVLARPESRWYRARKFVARNKLPVGAATAVVVALVAGLGAALWQAQVAREQAQRAEQVKSFMLSIFSQADPDAGGTGSTSSVDLLLQARQRIDKTVGNKPDIALELMTSVGHSLVGLGKTETAVPIFEEAVARYGTQLPAGDRRVLQAQLDLGEALLNIDRTKDAEVPLQTALAGMRRLDDTEGMIGALRWLSRLRARQRSTEAAILFAREAAQLAQARLGPDGRSTALEAQLELILALQTGRKAGLLEPSQRAYELAQSLYGNNLVRPMLVAREYYGTALVAEGEHPEQGVTLLKEAFAESSPLFGPTDRMVGYFAGRLGNGQLRVGDIHGAIDSFTIARSVWGAASDGKPTGDRAFGALFQGRGLSAAQQYQGAVAELASAVEIFTIVAGPDFSMTRQARSQYAAALAYTGALKKADLEFDKLLAVESRDPVDALILKEQLGTVRHLEGRLDEAERLLREAEQGFGGQVSDRAERANSLAALGATLVDAGRDAAALVEIDRALTIYRTLQPNLSPMFADALVARGRALLDLGRPDEAIEAFKEATNFWTGFGSDRRGAGLAFLWYARALNSAGQRAAASNALARARPVIAASPLESDKANLAAVERELVSPPGGGSALAARAPR
jgi:serine/threonine-protein kinase